MVPYDLMHFEGQRPNTGIKEAPKHLNTLICRNLKSIKKLYDDILMREREKRDMHNHEERQVCLNI